MIKRGLSILKSLLAGLIGVQSEKNREKDFAERKPLEIIIGGLLMVVFLLAVNALIVSKVLM